MRKIKHHAIDVQLSLSDLVTHVLQRHLDKEATMTASEPQTNQPMRLQPMIHVQNMGESVYFYEALGAHVAHGSRDGDFVMMQIGATQFSLLAHPPNPDQNEGTVELNFEAAEPLEAFEERLRAARVAITQPVTDEGFGRQLQVSSPDGLLIKINELDRDLYA